MWGELRGHPSQGLTETVINLDGSKEWVPESMALVNNDVKSINSPLIILSFSRDGTAGNDTGGFWIALNSGTAVLVCRLSVMLVCGLSVVTVAVGARELFIGGLSETSDNTSAGSSGWGLVIGRLPLREVVKS